MKRIDAAIIVTLLFIIACNVVQTRTSGAFCVVLMVLWMVLSAHDLLTKE